MADTVRPSVEEMFREIYSKNEIYHAQKEQFVWLPVTTYVGLVGVAVGWLLTHPERWIGHMRWWLLPTAFLICALLTCFAWIQNWYKVRSVSISLKLYAILRNFDNDVQPTFGQIADALGEDKLSWGPKVALIHKHGKPGLVLVLLMIVVTIALTAFILLYRNADLRSLLCLICPLP